MVSRLNSLSSSSLMRAHTPSPKSVPFGTTTAARAGRPAGVECGGTPHDELEKEQCGFGGLSILRKVGLDTLLFLAAEGRVGEDDVHAFFLTDLGEFVAECVAGINVRSVEAVQEQIHLA